MDRHNVQCRQGFAIQQFKLIRNGGRVAYQYRCVQIENAVDCKTGITNTSFGNRKFETIYLDRQNINVGNDRALTQFKLNTKYHRGVHYTYGFTSCKLGQKAPAPRPVQRPALQRPVQRQVNNNIPVYNKKTQQNDWGEGSIFYLDRHDVDCQNGFLLQGFHLTRPTPNTIAYEYACTKNIGTLNVNDSHPKDTQLNETSNDEKKFY